MAVSGFKSRDISVRKAERRQIKSIVRLYGVNEPKEKQCIASKWQKIIDKSEGDYHNDVTFVVKNRRNKIIGVLRSKAVENEKAVEVSIWLSTVERQERYMKHLLESLVEYYSEYETFDYISKIEMIKKNGNNIENVKLTGRIDVKAS